MNLITEAAANLRVTTASKNSDSTDGRKKTIANLNRCGKGLGIPAVFLIFLSCGGWGNEAVSGDTSQKPEGYTFWVEEEGSRIRVDPYYITGSKEHRERVTDLFGLLRQETQSGEERFSVIQEIANEYAKQKAYGRLINFLSAWSHLHPDDPYMAYYLLMIAFGYERQEAAPAAALYFDLIVKNYPDLLVRGESIHFIALNQLITLVADPEDLVWYYEELISRFSDKIDSGVTSFMLAQAYERTGEWSRAIETYANFLPYYGTLIPGFPNAYAYAKQLVDFNNSRKNWTFESLNSLLKAIERALDEGDSQRLWSYRARVNFFIRSWGQEDDDNSGLAEFNLSDFMQGNQIRYAPEFDAGSNANEVYLRTSGWSQWISTWYFYFRKIYFPPDPEIHGRWEWAGVYYGEKF